MTAPTIAAIKAAVAEECGVQVVDLEGSGRQREASRPRHLAMWLCARLTRHGQSEIGRHFGGRDHSSVSYAVCALERRMADLHCDGEEWDRRERLLERLSGAGITDADRVAHAEAEIAALQREVEAIQKRLRRLAVVLRRDPDRIHH